MDSWMFNKCFGNIFFLGRLHGVDVIASQRELSVLWKMISAIHSLILITISTKAENMFVSVS